jgi:hypothetical protein
MYRASSLTYTLARRLPVSYCLLVLYHFVVSIRTQRFLIENQSSTRKVRNNPHKPCLKAYIDCCAMTCLRAKRCRVSSVGEDGHCEASRVIPYAHRCKGSDQWLHEKNCCICNRQLRVFFTDKHCGPLAYVVLGKRQRPSIILNIYPSYGVAPGR